MPVLSRANGTIALAQGQQLWQIAHMDRGSGGRALIPAWRFVGGVLLHFVGPAYLVTLLIAGIVTALKKASVSGMIEEIVPFSVSFLLLYAVVGATVVGGLAIANALPRRPRAGHRLAPNIRRAAERVRRAIVTARTWDNTADEILTLLAAADWTDAAPEIQTLSADLADLIERTAEALKTARADRRSLIIALASDSMAHLANAYKALITERGRLDEGDARAFARYVEIRYGSSDFAGDA